MTYPVSIVRTFDAGPEAVFDAWVSPTSLVEPVIAVAMDPTHGGAIRISTGGGDENDLVGDFLVAERSARLRYTWSWGGSTEESLVDVQFHDLGDRTVVEVEHRGFHDEASRSIHLGGWVSYLDGLARYL